MTVKQAAMAVFALVLSGTGLFAAYQQVADENPPATAQEIRDKTRTFVIRAAARLKAGRVGAAEATSLIVQRTGVDAELVAPVVDMAYSGRGRAPEATYSRHIGVAALLANESLTESAISSAMCRPLEDISDAGAGQEHAECLSDNGDFLTERYCDSGGTEVARGGRVRMMPAEAGDVLAALPPGAIVVDPATDAAWDAARTSRGLHRCTGAELGLE